MNKFNKLGDSLLDCKRELLKDYPEIITNSLIFFVKDMLEKQIIDEDVFELLKNKNINFNDFRNTILFNSNCIKTQEELLEEYESIIQKISEFLDFERSDIKASEDIEKEIISLSKAFIIPISFIKNYFDIDSEESFREITKQQGFMHKFAVLRMPKIIAPFIKEGEFFDVVNSDVFFQKEEESYGIFISFNIKLAGFENNKILEDTIGEISNILESVQVAFKNGLSC
ncbi:hypothetical protein SI855_002802 [Clostridioides difficile]|nr:hypothetical protein [Clostridioides difficile]